MNAVDGLILGSVNGALREVVPRVSGIGGRAQGLGDLAVEFIQQKSLKEPIQLHLGKSIEIETGADGIVTKEQLRSW